MEDYKSKLDELTDELLKWGTEIEDLKAIARRARVGTRADLIDQIYELRVRTEVARDNLIRVFMSIRGQNQNGKVDIISASKDVS